MKRFVVLIVLIFISNVLMSQEDFNLYLEGLKLHLTYLKDLSKGNEANVYFVESANQITNNLPRTINGMNIDYLDKAAIKNKGKVSQFHLIVIRPMKLVENKIEINLIDYFIDYKKRNFNYVNTGGSKLIFKYDCTKEHYVLHEKFQGEI
jgi:hypothetical protein